MNETLLRMMKKTPSPDIRTLRRQVEGLGVTLYWQGSQWILCDRETEPLGHSIKTERDALEFVLDRARDRERLSGQRREFRSKPHGSLHEPVLGASAHLALNAVRYVKAMKGSRLGQAPQSFPLREVLALLGQGRRRRGRGSSTRLILEASGRLIDGLNKAPVDFWRKYRDKRGLVDRIHYGV